MMLTREQIRDHLGKGLGVYGVPYRLFTWEWESDQVCFHVYLELLRQESRARIEVYFAPLGFPEIEGFELRGNSFPFFVLAKRLPLGVDCDVDVVERLDNGVYSDEERLECFVEIGEALGQYVTAHCTIEDLLGSYAGGEYNKAYIHRVIRPVFDRELEARGLPLPDAETSELQWMDFVK